MKISISHDDYFFILSLLMEKAEEIHQRINTLEENGIDASNAKNRLKEVLTTKEDLMNEYNKN